MNIYTDRESFARSLWEFIHSSEGLYQSKFRNEHIIKAIRGKGKFTFLKQDNNENTIKFYDIELFTSASDPGGVNKILKEFEL